MLVLKLLSFKYFLFWLLKYINAYLNVELSILLMWRIFCVSSYSSTCTALHALNYAFETSIICPFLCPQFVVVFCLFAESLVWGFFSLFLVVFFSFKLCPLPQPGHLFNFDWISSNEQNTLLLLAEQKLKIS